MSFVVEEQHGAQPHGGPDAVELWRAERREAVLLLSPGLSATVEEAPYSPGYGELQTACVVVARGHLRAPVRLGAVLLFDDEAHPGDDA